MSYAIEALRTYLERDHVSCEVIEEEGNARIAWMIGGKAAQYQAYAWDIPTGHLWIYVVSPVRVPEHRRTRAAELLAWVNYGLRWGVFELDPRDGEVRFRTASLVPRKGEQKRIIDDLFRQACTLMDEFFPLIVEGVFAPEPVDVAYRRLYSAMDGAARDDRVGDTRASEVLERVERLAQRDHDAPSSSTAEPRG